MGSEVTHKQVVDFDRSCYGVDGYDGEIAGESGVEGWIENWSARDSEEMVQREVRRRQRQNRSQPPSKVTRPPWEVYSFFDKSSYNL